MDPGDPDEPSREELESRVEQLEETVSKMLPDRRGVLKGLGAAAIGGAAVGASTGGASGQSATGQVGTESEPVDVEGAQGNFDSVNTDELNNTNRIIVQGSNGNIVESFPRSDVQKAIDAISNGGGLVRLAQGTNHDGSDLSIPSGVSIVGLGYRPFDKAEDGSVLSATTLTIDGPGTYLDGFRLKGPGVGAAKTDALDVSTTTHFTIGNIAVSDYYGRVMFSSANLIGQTLVGRIFVNTVDSGDSTAMFDLDAGTTNDWGQIVVYPNDTTSGKDSNIFNVTGNHLRVRSINVGGSPGYVFDSSAGGGVGHINYEPSSKNSNNSYIVRLYKDTAAHAGHVRNHSSQIDQYYWLDGGGGKTFGTYEEVGGTPGNVLQIASAPSGKPTIFHGPSGAVFDNASAGTNLVSCLGDLTLTG